MRRLVELKEVLRNRKDVLKNNNAELVYLTINLFLENIDKVKYKDSLKKEIIIKHNGIKITIYKNIWGNYFLEFKRYFDTYKFTIAVLSEEYALDYRFVGSKELVEIHKVLWEKNKSKPFIKELKILEKLINRLK